MAVNNIKKNSKYFYSYARKKAKLSVPVGPIEDPNGKLVSDPLEMVTILSSQYKSVFSMPSNIDLDFTVTPPNMISDIDFTENDIFNAIDELHANSAPGPDRFPAIFLKECKHELAKPLHLIWRQSLDTGQVPENCKFSNIVPIHKGEKRNVAKNYRPVSLTSHLVKVFERVLRSFLVEYIELNNLINLNQYRK